MTAPEPITAEERADRAERVVNRKARRIERLVVRVGAADRPAGGTAMSAREPDDDCWCGANGGEGCCCCTDECPEDCTADHRGEQ